VKWTWRSLPFGAWALQLVVRLRRGIVRLKPNIFVKML
jgi:hypothetical protein